MLSFYFIFTLKLCLKGIYIHRNCLNYFEGMAADVGTLQRLPRLIGSASLVNELAFTARKLPSNEAKDCGLVSNVFPDKDR